MDKSIDALITRYRDLTAQYQNAVHGTYMAFASVGPAPSAAALKAWKDALNKEEEVKRQRDDTYLQIMHALSRA